MKSQVFCYVDPEKIIITMNFLKFKEVNFRSFMVFKNSFSLTLYIHETLRSHIRTLKQSNNLISYFGTQKKLSLDFKLSHEFKLNTQTKNSLKIIN